MNGKGRIKTENPLGTIDGLGYWVRVRQLVWS